MNGRADRVTRNSDWQTSTELHLYRGMSTVPVGRIYRKETRWGQIPNVSRDAIVELTTDTLLEEPCVAPSVLLMKGDLTLDALPKWDTDVMRLLETHVQTPFTCHYTDNRPAKLETLQGHHVYCRLLDRSNIKYTLQVLQSLMSKSCMHLDTVIFVIPRSDHFRAFTKHLRQLRVVLPPFFVEKYDGTGQIMQTTTIQMDAFYQHVMPKQRLDRMLHRSSDSDDSTEDELEAQTCDISSLDFGTESLRTSWAEKRAAACLAAVATGGPDSSTPGGEGEILEYRPGEEFLAFDCHVSNSLTKEQIPAKMHLDTKATRSLISTQMARRLNLRIEKTSSQRARLANGTFIPIQGTACFIMKLQGVKAGTQAIVIDNAGMTSDFLLGEDWAKKNIPSLNCIQNQFEWLTSTGQNKYMVRIYGNGSRMQDAGHQSGITRQ